MKTILDQVYTVHTVYMYIKATLRTPLERRVARRAGLLFFRVLTFRGPELLLPGVPSSVFLFPILIPYSYLYSYSIFLFSPLSALTIRPALYAHYAC